MTRCWAPGSAWCQAEPDHQPSWPYQSPSLQFSAVTLSSLYSQVHPVTLDHHPFQSGLSFSPIRPQVSLAQPWPVLRPPWLHSHILLPAQGTEKLLALPKTLCAL